MKSSDKKFLFISLFVMGLSGVLLHIIDEHFKIITPYGHRSNPWLDHIKLVHNIFNFIFIFGVGRIFNSHIWLGLSLKKKKHRTTGFAIAISIPLLVISGCLLLYISQEKLISIIEATHWYLGLFFIFSFIFHYLHFRRSKKLRVDK